MKVSSWGNCYNHQWTGLIVPESFSHPAKFSPGLIQRIFRHMLRRGYLKPGDAVGDPFGGIGGGGIFAAQHRLRWIGCELESRFVDLAKQNFELHATAWAEHGYPLPTIIQGDSRRFSEIVGQAAAVVTSPPYAEGLSKEHTYSDHEKREAGTRRNIYGEKGINDPFYGASPGQIGTLKAGNLDAVCTSPPYGEAQTGGGIAVNGYVGEHLHKQGKNQPDKVGPRCGYMKDVHGRNPSNIGNLKMDGVVTSPPWETQNACNDKNYAVVRKNRGGVLYGDYGSATCQIGNDQGETYWTAMRQVYAECWKSLKPGGTMAVVVKAYAKNKRRIPLPQQTLKMLLHLGFEPIERTKAMLVSRTVNGGLFGDDVVEERARKSFFRRLAEKNGSPRIDWEEVLIVRKHAA